jgi:GNAT superfamily N-acetyltransferase
VVRRIEFVGVRATAINIGHEAVLVLQSNRLPVPDSTARRHALCRGYRTRPDDRRRDVLRCHLARGFVMTMFVQRINENTRAALATHFLALSNEDRRLRFGSSLSCESIAAYVGEMDFESSAVFAVHDDSLALVGVAHVAFADEFAELGLSVLPAHRGHGVGGALFHRAAVHARNRSMPRLFMHCLQENVPIMHIARRFGMNIVTDVGDADAHLVLPPASHESITGELVTDGFALYDHALKAHIAAWKRVQAVLSGAAPSPGPIRIKAPQLRE